MVTIVLKVLETSFQSQAIRQLLKCAKMVLFVHSQSFMNRSTILGVL